MPNLYVDFLQIPQQVFDQVFQVDVIDSKPVKLQMKKKLSIE